MFYDVSCGIYQTSIPGHRCKLTTRIKLQQQKKYCHLKVDTRFLRSVLSSYDMLTKPLHFLSIPIQPQLLWCAHRIYRAEINLHLNRKKKTNAVCLKFRELKIFCKICFYALFNRNGFIGFNKCLPCDAFV